MLLAKKSLEPPYYAVIFSSQRGIDDPSYNQMTEFLETLAQVQPGFLGIESARNIDGKGITISYWKSLEDIKGWKKQTDHQSAQQQGQENWYQYYKFEISLVQRVYEFKKGKPGNNDGESKNAWAR